MRGLTKFQMTHRSFFRMAVIVGTGIFLAGLFFLVYYFFLAWPMGIGPAGPPVPKEPFTSVWSEREVVLLGFGDSMTAGYGASPGKSYIARLYENPPDEFPEMKDICLKKVLPKLQIKNASVSGSNSIQHAESHIPAFKPFPKEIFGIVVMTTGGNDLIHWYGRKPPEEGAMYGATLEQAKSWIANYEARLNKMLDDITRLFPGGCRIFLGTIYDPSDGGGNPRWAGMPSWNDAMAILDAYNDVILRSTKKHVNVAVVDIHKAFLGHGVRCAQFWTPTYHPEDPHYWYFGNIEDPNERGYDALRRLFLLKILEVFGTSPSSILAAPAP